MALMMSTIVKVQRLKSKAQKLKHQDSRSVKAQSAKNKV